jgi:simple sugar transport system substrate-binding protein
MKEKALRRALIVLVVVLGMLLPTLVFATGQNEGAKAGKTYKMVTIVKLKSPWFDELEKGIMQANKDFGIDGYMLAPASPDPVQQVKMVDDAISKGVNAICVVPNDAQALEPVFAKAKAKGIVIMTHESPNQKNADYDVELIDNQKFGETSLELLVKYMGTDKAQYALFVGSLTVPLHNIWADASVALAKQKYPNLKLVADRFPVAEDQSLARQKALEIITAYPDIKGILCYGSQGGPGAAQAVREKGLSDKIAVVGGGSPQQQGQYFEDGSLKAGTQWDPKWGGYGMEYVAKLVLDGKKVTDGMDIPNIGKVILNGNTIKFDHTLITTKENWKEFNF